MVYRFDTHTENNKTRSFYVLYSDKTGFRPIRARAGSYLYFNYYYKCGLCDTDYVGFTSRHLHQHVEEHKRSTIGYHVKDEHGGDPDSIGNNFEILKKCHRSARSYLFSVSLLFMPEIFFCVFALFLCKYFRVLVSILLAFL